MCFMYIVLLIHNHALQEVNNLILFSKLYHVSVEYIPNLIGVSYNLMTYLLEIFS